MDIILGILLIIIFAIPMCVIAIIIKISDPKNPVLYSQIRLSRFNKRIKIYKYRSIKIEYSGLTPEDAFLKYCHGKKAKAKILSTSFRKNGDYLTNDPRLTNIGKFLRRTSLDELPQLFNVVKGDISLVGPRALVPGELKHYGNRSLILSVKSGLTGLAQVSGRRSISFKERRALDLYYVENWSVRFDIKILLRTIKAVFKGTGAK